jgi:CelD/BcsL family acetyltransferase involved in cellulose biosynthesis
MKAEIIDESREQAWDEMVEKHPYGSVFQHSAYKKVIASTFAHTEPYYIALINEKREIVGGIPLFLVKSWLTKNRLVSLPFAPYSDPLIRSPEEFKFLFQQVLKLYKDKRASYLEIKVRNTTSLLETVETLKPVLYHRTFWIDLTQGLDKIWKQFHKTCIQDKIRKSQKKGIVIRSAVSIDEVKYFWQLLRATRKRLGIPPQSYNFFHNIWKYLKPLDLADFLIAEMNEQIVGGSTIYKFRNILYGGHITSIKKYQSLGLDQALFWKAIQIGVNEGYETLDIGKTSPFAEGLMAYKKRWGAQELETPCFYYPTLRGVSSQNNETKPLYKIMTFMWRHMPDWLLKTGGRFAYRHLG